jgi:hypothetical protein
MDDLSIPALPDDGWAEAFSNALHAQRVRARNFLAALAERQRRAESELEAWLAESGDPERIGASAGEPPGDSDRFAAASERVEPRPQESPETEDRLNQRGGFDWEAEKRRTLAGLECKADDPSPHLPDSRKEIEQIVRKTDRLMDEKDREIADLKRLLQDQSAGPGSLAVESTAAGELLDRDPIVRQEREQLRRVQAEWQEKIRNGEIEISIERAKLARQRADLDESLRARSGLAEKGEGGGKPAPTPEKPPSGRWLARLGLKDPKTT